MSPWLVIVGAVAMVAMLLAPALLMAYVHDLLAEERRKSWSEGFDAADRVHRQTERRWGPKPWESPSRQSAPGKGSGLPSNAS